MLWEIADCVDAKTGIATAKVVSPMMREVFIRFICLPMYYSTDSAS